MSNLNEFTICGLPQAPDHPMWNKMWQRAGLDPKLARTRFRPIYQGLDDIQSPVLVLGEQALQYVGQQSDLFRWRGRQIDTGRFLVYPTLEPHRMLPRFADEDDGDDEGKGLNHAPARFQGTWVWDVQQALAQGTRLRPRPSYEHYCVDPPAHVWQQWVRDLLVGPRLSFDIETAYKMSQMDDEEWEASGLMHGQMLRISFCAQPGRSISVSWSSQYMEGIKTLLASDMAKVGWNCPAADHKVLTWDMQWVRADSLRPGDALVGLDEHRPGPGRRRRYQKAIVTACERSQAELYAVTFDDGTVVRVTAEHPWLVAGLCNSAIGHNVEWKPTSKLKPGHKMAKVIQPWDTSLNSYEAGYLAGFYDGEGSICDLRLSLHQNAGPTYDYAVKIARQLGFAVNTGPATMTDGSKNHKLQTMTINGVEQVMRFLGIVRPQRLLNNLKPQHLGVFQAHKEKWRTVVSVESIGMGDIMHIETSTHTYVLEGFGAHNCAAFDVPRLEAEGIHVGGRIYDYQDGWHIVQSDLPKGLEWVTSYYTTFQPWKHLSGSDPGLYSCIDSDAALQNALGIDEALAKNYQTQLFERHVTDLMPLLKRAGQRGNLIDLGYSYALEKEMKIHRDQMEIDVQPMVPEELKPRKRYKREPDHQGEQPIYFEGLGLPKMLVLSPSGRKFEAVEVNTEIKVCSHCLTPVQQWADHMKGRKKGTKNDPDNYNPCKAAEAKAIKVPGTTIEWDEILPWNPNSSDQLKEYVLHHNHPMGLNRQTDQPSVAGKHLDKLAKKYGHTHPVYPLVAEYKRVSKTISTYVYHNYADPFGFIHSTYTNAPSTFRLAAQNLNLTNVGKRETNKWTVRARRQIIARPGYIFVDADSTSIEAVVTGYLIGDENFMRMAGKSIHAWLCCQELGWEFNDQTLELVKSQHKDLYNKMKTAIYLLLYGGDPYLMHMENPENFPTVADARLIQDKIFTLVPKLQEWQERTREQAKKEGVLTSPWGYRHHFYDVYTFKRNKQGQIEYDHQGRPKIKLGKDGKRCLAFLPQNSAASFGRDSLLILGQSKWGQYMSANCFVHDGYTLEVPVELQDEAEQFLVQTLTRPVPELGGIRIGCESGKGLNWAEADPKAKFWPDGNPEGMKTVRKVEVF